MWSGEIVKLRALVFLFLLVSADGSLSWSQTSTAARKSANAVASEKDQQARLRKYLDKDGGYRTQDGGYYNPNAGTFTDKDGLIADNWSGVTYPNGSYKSKLGDYYDAPARTYKLADGRVAKVPNLTPAEAIKALRDNVAVNDGYDKNLTVKSMMMRIELDHPAVPVVAKHP